MLSKSDCCSEVWQAKQTGSARAEAVLPHQKSEEQHEGTQFQIQMQKDYPLNSAFNSLFTQCSHHCHHVAFGLKSFANCL